MDFKTDQMTAKGNSMIKVSEQYQFALQELNNLQNDFQKDYNRLLDLLSQGHIETVLQIISHRKALISLKS